MEETGIKSKAIAAVELTSASAPVEGQPSAGNSAANRRQFMKRALAATSGLAAAQVLPSLLTSPTELSAQTPCAVETLTKVGEITSVNKKMKGVLKIKNGPKALPGITGNQRPMMRYFEGYNQQVPTPPVWPKDKTGCFPGPTLRVGIGEQVEITFLNQVDVGAFPGHTLDAAETGATTGCDVSTNGTLDPPDKNWYPGTRGDTFPNCFHGSSTANLHFHGTHVSPDGFADNVLVQVRPDPSITERVVEDDFKKIFDHCEHHPGIPAWRSLPEEYRNKETTAVQNYDLHAIWKNVRGPVKDPRTGKEIPALPHANQLAPVNADNLARGLWPTYFVGAYPNCFKVTEATGHSMGQAPGTFWYHAHKHGSTAINIFNGLAGALIIEGKYDEDLKKIYPNLKQTEKVMVLQIYEDLPNLERASGGTQANMTNGTQVVTANGTTPQQGPTVVMRPGEIQLWRIINAKVQATLTAAFSGPANTKVSPLPQFRQIAQDGVQFKFFNYDSQPLTSPDPATKNGTKFTLAAGGRADILVQAPLLPAGTTQASYELAGVCNLAVCGAPVDTTVASGKFPDSGNYPEFPLFLTDIPTCRHSRTLTFGWEPFRLRNGPAAQGSNFPAGKTFPFDVKVNPDTTITIHANRGPYWTIDDEQFSESKFYQTMVLGDIEEWTITNNTSVAHPFHIHVNPFQVVELFDPNTPANNFKRDSNAVWQDNILVPAAKVDNKLLVIGDDGKATTPGFVRIRSRFADFVGSFVLHCHILAHEDRGMMQLVRVVDKATTLKHH